ncbi:MAG: Beta-lactamase [Firmicutes bacterium]|nr:Beta-lactamase [Bacillota bacterium]
MRKFLMALLIMGAIQWTTMAGATAATVIREDFSRYFDGLTGAFVLYEPATDTYRIYNEEQSNKRLSPCSSFKIFNSLIGLETGVLDRNDTLTLMPWDGTHYDTAGWNRDHTLASATRESVVWYFQALARRIGAERMQLYLDRIGYGNRDISGGLTRFWLRSSLQISAMEQVDVLKTWARPDPGIRMENGFLAGLSATLKHREKFMSLQPMWKAQMKRAASKRARSRGGLPKSWGCCETKERRTDDD